MNANISAFSNQQSIKINKNKLETEASKFYIFKNQQR